MTLFWLFLAALAAGALTFARLVAVAARWGRELLELEAHGVETTGIILRKVRYSSRGGQSRYFKYEYRDQFGKPHRRKTLVLDDAWDRHHEGGPIAVIYSQRTPSISAAKFLFDTMARARRESRQQGGGPV